MELSRPCEVALTRVRLGLSAAPALLLLGPSTLYFSLMRFDILCALVLCLSLAAFARGRYLLAHVLLGVATLVKWYPAVVFPVYLAFHLSQEPASRVTPCTCSARRRRVTPPPTS